MNPQDNKEYVKNSLLFLILAFLLIFGWNILFPPAAKKVVPPTPVAAQSVAAGKNTARDTVNLNNADRPAAAFSRSRTLTVHTDNYLLHIDEATGDINYLELLRQQDGDKTSGNKILFNQDHNYTAQSRLINTDNQFFAANIPFRAEKTQFELNGQKQLTVTLSKDTPAATVKKSFLFNKNSYLITFNYEITNKSTGPLALTAMYRLLHDGSQQQKNTFLTSFYNGPVFYTAAAKFEKLPFTDIAAGKVNLPQTVQSGWLGMTQHYFSSVFILQPKNLASVCGSEEGCRVYIDQKAPGKLFQVAFTAPVAVIAPQQKQSLAVNLFAGPQESKSLAKIADNLALLKDYGLFRIFANPLFMTLQFIENYTGNWGWAIILLVILLKIILYPLNATSAKSMAQMRHIAPKMKKLQETYADDKVKLQKEMMELYKKEKVNPLAGCLPMLLQFPIFIGLYWAIFNSVELRGAPWLGWITDLSRLDPYFILPVLMSLTMIAQSFVNPPPADPMQAKLMKIIPLVFSVMFFFFPAGLVLYWIVNNILTILQQLRFNRKYAHNPAG